MERDDPETLRARVRELEARLADTERARIAAVEKLHELRIDLERTHERSRVAARPRDRWFTDDLVDRPAHPRRRELRVEPGEAPRIAPRHDQRLPPQARCDRPGPLQRPRPEDDPPRARELEGRHGPCVSQPASPGKRLVKLRALRGSAIIGATASRHFR